MHKRLPGNLRFQERRPVVFVLSFPVLIIVAPILGVLVYAAVAGEEDPAEDFSLPVERGHDPLFRT